MIIFFHGDHCFHGVGFLLPIIQRQMMISNIAEEGTDDDDSVKSPSPPVGLVLVPTPDLAHQVC